MQLLPFYRFQKKTVKRLFKGLHKRGFLRTSGKNTARPELDNCLKAMREGDRLHAVLSAAGYHLRWLLRMIAKKGVPLLRLPFLRLLQARGMGSLGGFVARVAHPVGFGQAGLPVLVG